MTLTLLSAHISGYNNEIFVATKDMAPGRTVSWTRKNSL